MKVPQEELFDIRATFGKSGQKGERGLPAKREPWPTAMNCSCAATLGCNGGKRTSNATGGRGVLDWPSTRNISELGQAVFEGLKSSVFQQNWKADHTGLCCMGMRCIGN